MAKMISLKLTGGGNGPQSPGKYVPPKYPVLCVENVELGITPADVGKTFTAQVKLKVRSATERLEGKPGGKQEKRASQDFEVMEIGLGAAEPGKEAPAPKGRKPLRGAGRLLLASLGGSK